MSQLTEIIVRSGLLNGNALAELKKWGLPLEMPESLTYPELKAVQAPEAFDEAALNKLCTSIDEAIQSEGYVLLRTTDLEAIPQYLKTMTEAKLHLVTEDGTASNYTVHVGKNPNGDYIIPWRSDSITDLLTNGETFLRLNNEKIYFNSAQELFYGANKAFVVCTPSTRESDGKRG